MENLVEMTVCACYNQRGMQRIKRLKLLRIALVICLFMAWTYGVAIAASFVQEGSGAATFWMLQFAAYTIPATALLLLVWIGLRRLTRSYDYCLREDQLEIWTGDVKRKLVVQINCFSIAAFYPAEEAPSHSGREINAVVSKYDRWALDVRHDGSIVRVWLQPNEEFARRLKSYVQQQG